MRLDLPDTVIALAQAVREAGGRALVVGGAVRDARLGRPVKDLDLEVYGLAPEPLAALLAAHGRVDLVGQAFAVYKLSGLVGWKGALDVSVPRRDSKAGPGHRGITVAGDPGLSVTEASRRRDFTINALLYDPLTDEVVDPQGGLRDLEEGRLRAVDPLTFGEDPLRALRAAQFAARFELKVDAATARLCSAMPLGELPAERVLGEMEKLLLRSRRPSKGVRLLAEWDQLRIIAPELLPLMTTPQDPIWHPEGDVFTHTLMALDVGAGLCDGLDRPRALTLMLALLCHDLGKPATTRFEEGRWRSRGHEQAGVAPTLALLDRWNVHSLLGYDVRAQVVGLVAQHLKPQQLYDERERVKDGAIRRLARKCEPGLLGRVARADCLGRGGEQRADAMDWFEERIRALDVVEHLPAQLIGGRDVLELGVPAGPEVGRILREVYEHQLDGRVRDAAQALATARELARLAPSGDRS
jgi:tRNA nucleotidyltransferase (CCA-adding enzyme)